MNNFVEPKPQKKNDFNEVTLSTNKCSHQHCLFFHLFLLFCDSLLLFLLLVYYLLRIFRN